MREEIKKMIIVALKELDFAVPENIEITHPDILDHGDFTTSFVLGEARKVGQNPREFAEQILAQLLTLENPNIEKIEIAGPGFINFFLSKKFYAEQINSIILKKEKWGSNNILDSKTYLSEKVSPNMFKPFHIGHTVGITFGESLTRIFEASGAKTITMSYPSDVSLGIAKAVWSIVEEKKSESFSIDDMGIAYARGTQKYDESKTAQSEIIAINKNIYAGIKDKYFTVYEEGVKKNLAYFKNISERLGTNFEHFIFESEAGKSGLPIVRENIGKVFEESKGAVIYDGESKGLHTRVFINSEGLPTYESKDIGLLDLKFKQFSFDKSFVYTDMEQQKYFEVLKMAAGEINPEWAEKSEYLQHGRLNFSGGKISSRYGNVPLAEDLLDTVKESIAKVMEQKDFSKEDKEDIAEKISIGALKYSFLKVTMGKNMLFDFATSLDFSGNSGPYLQYSYVRAKSILRKNEVEINSIMEKVSYISDLEKILYRFPEAIEKSLNSYSPHHLTNYLYDLASEFNSFYAQEKISDSGNSDYQYNLQLVASFAQTMKNGLYLLGIETVEKM